MPRKPQDPRPPNDIPEKERYYFLEERYPKYGNLVPRDIATREIFKVCIQEGLSVEPDRLCVYLDVTHLPRELLDRKLAGILEIYEKFQGVDPRTTAMKIFPAVHYTMGGLWCDYERTAEGGLAIGSPRNQQTNVPGDLRHRRVRLPVPRREPAGGQFAGGLHFQRPDRRPGRDGLHRQSARRKGRRSAVVALRSGGLQASGRVQGPAGPAGGRTESVYAAPGTGPADDQKRHGGPPQSRSGSRPTPSSASWKSEARHCTPVGPGQLGEPERGLRPRAAGHVPAGQDDRQRRA